MSKWIALLVLSVAVLGCQDKVDKTHEEPPAEGIVEEHVGWMTDFEKAKAKAKADNKHILIDFSGSDWCVWCIKLDKDVFSQKAFKDYAKDNLVLLLVDWPTGAANSKEVQAKSKPIMEKYGVERFPTVIVLSPDGEPVAKTGYQNGGPDAYVEHIKKLIAEAK